MCRTREENAADAASEAAFRITSNQWGEGRRVFILTDQQAELIADALEIVSPNDERMEEMAQAMAVQFRSAAREHPDTDEHRAGCASCQYAHDCKLPD